MIQCHGCELFSQLRPDPPTNQLCYATMRTRWLQASEQQMYAAFMRLQGHKTTSSGGRSLTALEPALESATLLIFAAVASLDGPGTRPCTAQLAMAGRLMRSVRTAHRPRVLATMIPAGRSMLQPGGSHTANTEKGCVVKSCYKDAMSTSDAIPAPTGSSRTFYKRELPCPPATAFSSAQGATF